MTDATKVEKLVERVCRECNGTGIAEHIEHMTRPCDVCGGDGTLSFTATENGLLDQCEAQAADNARLREALTMMVEDQCDYMNRNQLGDPEKQYMIKVARAALAATEPNDDKSTRRNQ